MLFRQEMQRIKSLGLRFGDRGNILRSRLGLEASEVASCVLDQNSLGGGIRGGLVVKKRAQDIGLGRVIEPGQISVEIVIAWVSSYPSTGQS